MSRDDLVARFAAFPGFLAGAILEAAGVPIPAGEWGPA